MKFNFSLDTAKAEKAALALGLKVSATGAANTADRLERQATKYPEVAAHLTHLAGLYREVHETAALAALNLEDASGDFLNFSSGE